jgi:hypothetical protein
MASQSGVYNLQQFTDLGALSVGGRLYTYAYGTTTQKTAYTDAAGAVPQTYTNDGLGGQYIALNARGELPAPLFLSASGSYDLALKTAAGATVWTRRADATALGSEMTTVQSSLSTAQSSLVQANQTATNLIFPQDGAHIQRFNDRIMVGGATASDLLFPNVIKDWLTTLQIAAGLPNGTILNCQACSLVSTSPSAAIGFVVGSRSKYIADANSTVIGLASYAWADNTSDFPSCWALYAEAHREATAFSLIYGMEIDVRSMFASIEPKPWAQGDSIGIQMGVGAGFSATGQFDCSAGIQFVANPMQWKVGISFMHDSIDGTDGLSGEGCAIRMANYQNIEWFDASGNRSGALKCRTTTLASRTAVVMNNSGFFVVGAAEQALMLVEPITLSVNYPRFSASISGSPVAISAIGTDANIGLWLRTTGTGVVQFGTLTASADAPVVGSISIKDDTGTARKLAVIA